MRRKEMKKLYEEGNHICVSRWVESEPRLSSDKGFEINERPDFSDLNGEFKLIHKRHERILDAYLKDMDRDLYYQIEGRTYIVTGGFIEGYNEDYEYSLNFTKMLLSKKENLGYNITEELKEKNYDFQEFSKAIDEQLKEECMFAKCGFEVPDFHCEILKEVNGTLYGIYYSKAKADFPILFDAIDGQCLLKNMESMPSAFNLTPIKKPWYEEESNFPCLVVEDDENLIVCANKYEWIDLDKHHEGIFRRATREEVLSLYKEVK